MLICTTFASGVVVPPLVMQERSWVRRYGGRCTSAINQPFSSPPFARLVESVDASSGVLGSYSAQYCNAFLQ